MTALRVWRPGEPLPADEWRQRLREADAEVVAVLEADHNDEAQSLVDALGRGDLVSAFRPLSDALKVVANGLVIDSIDRTGLVELAPPYAFRVKAALAVLTSTESAEPVELLEVLARHLQPIPFHSRP